MSDVFLKSACECNILNGKQGFYSNSLLKIRFIQNGRRKEMKKYFLGICSIVAVFFSFTGCLNPINFDEVQLPAIEITGTLNTSDVTAASTYFVNMSKTLNFTNVTITQKENETLAQNDEPYLVTTFPNTKNSQGQWKNVKARYIQASDIEYEVELTIISGDNETPVFKKTTDLLATQSKGIYYVWMYRTKDQAYIDAQKAAGVPDEFADVILASPQNPNLPPPLPAPDENDTQNIEVNVGSSNNADVVSVLEKISNSLINSFIDSGLSADDENGSVPPVVSPHNRSEMGTFVVVNLSRTQNIDSVEFKQETGVETTSNVHTIISTSQDPITYAVRTQDRNAIALKNGTYLITAYYGGTESTVAKRGVLVPSNDPQTVREHYAYFYKAKSGSYELSINEPKEGDIDLSDVLPYDEGHGVGRVRIINNTTNALVHSISLTSKDHPERGSETKGFNEFIPKTPIGNGVGEVDFIGTPAFPIDGYFFANVQLYTVKDVVTVASLIYLKGTVATIYINPNGGSGTTLDPDKEPGAKIVVNNNTGTANKTASLITKIEIFNTETPTEHSDFTLNIDSGSSDSFYVLNTPGMPLKEGASYKARLYVTVIKEFTGTYIVDGNEVVNPVISKTGTVEKNFSPDSNLYGKNGPDSHVRTVTLGSSDITSIIPATPPTTPPPPPPPVFVPVTDVLILNGEPQPNGSIKFFDKDGAERQLSWKVIPDEATHAVGHWTLGEADPNLIIAEIFHTTPPYALSADGKLKVDSSWSYNYLNVAFIIPNGKAEGARIPRLNELGAMQYLLFDEDKDFVKVFKLISPPPASVPLPPATPNEVTLLFVHSPGQWTSDSASWNSENNWAKNHWSTNLVEVYRRPLTVNGVDDVTDEGPENIHTGQTTGSVATGRTGYLYQFEYKDDDPAKWGSRTEGWVTAGYANVPVADRPSDAADYAAEVLPNFVDSIGMTAGNGRKGVIKGQWITQHSSNNKLDQAGEKYAVTVPADQGKLWIRIRNDDGKYIGPIAGQSWFVFDPAYNYVKENGRVVIDVLGTTYIPRLTYR
jgi:hypothetical protein